MHTLLPPGLLEKVSDGNRSGVDMGGDTFRFGRDVPEYQHRPSGFILQDGVEVAATLQCCHCGKHWIPIKGSGRTRGFCMGCSKPVCGEDKCIECVPFQKKLDLYEKKKIASL